MFAFSFFQISGDVLHAVSHCLLIKKLNKSKTASGVSLKSQILFAIVYTTRYYTIIFNYYFFYLWAMKLFYVASIFYLIYLLVHRYRDSYQKELDKIPIYALVIPSYAIALVTTRPFTVADILWNGSLFLESLCLIPQFYMLTQTKNIENVTSNYVAAQGGYRAFYMVNWFYLQFVEDFGLSWQVWVSGVLQMIMFGEFFWHWLRSKWSSKSLELPK